MFPRYSIKARIKTGEPRIKHLKKLRFQGIPSKQGSRQGAPPSSSIIVKIVSKVFHQSKDQDITHFLIITLICSVSKVFHQSKDQDT